MPDADIDMAAKIVADSVYGCAGQRCLAASNIVTVADNKDVINLTEAICAGLQGDEENFSLITVDAFVKLGNGQHVFPSQNTQFFLHQSQYLHQRGFLEKRFLYCKEQCQLTTAHPQGNKHPIALIN